MRIPPALRLSPRGPWFFVVACWLAASLPTALAWAAPPGQSKADDHHDHHAPAVEFTLRSARSGAWSDAGTWNPARVPGAGDRVLVSRGTDVLYDVESDAAIRLVQVVGKLRFSRQKNTTLTVCVLKVQNSDVCSESGFACDFEGVNKVGEPTAAPRGETPTLEIGTLEKPIPPEVTARVRLRLVDGVSKTDGPALVCCSARMDLHGAPLSRTWLKLAADVPVGAVSARLAEPVSGWRVGDEILLTAAQEGRFSNTHRGKPEASTSETRRIVKIEGDTVTFEPAAKFEHWGSGEFKSEVANLSRNVIIESADPQGARGHVLYHAYSQGGVSYTRFAHLGKEGVLGRYALHFHLVGDTMRGSAVLGAAIVDSHNRWITIHGAEYLVVRDCVGFQSVGHGFFLEDATEVYNLLDRNLGVQAYKAKRLPEQVLPFDPNDGAAFWWSNGRNTLTRNVSCENDEYGFRYDMQNSRYFSSTLPVRMADGQPATIDVRTIPIWRFEQNESHNEGLYGLVVAANGGNQPDSPIQSERDLREFLRLDWTGPDARHPHVIRDYTAWRAHYAVRPHSPSMLLENIRLHDSAYGVYRPAFDKHVYRNLRLSKVEAEPFNRGMDDASAQHGVLTVDGLTFEDFNQYGLPLVQMTDNNLGGGAECHFRNLKLINVHPKRGVFDRGGGAQADPVTAKGVPYHVHDHFGPGRDARVVSVKAKDLLADGSKYVKTAGLTGEESLAAEVGDAPFPNPLDPVDDEPPATVILDARESGGRARVTGVSHDNGPIRAITVNGQAVEVVSRVAGVVDWRVELPMPADGKLVAQATDEAGNVEQTPHTRRVN